MFQKPNLILFNSSAMVRDVLVRLLLQGIMVSVVWVLHMTVKLLVISYCGNEQEFLDFSSSNVLGIRMLDQPYMTDLIEANSMGHEPHKIHIYSASWGPTDDGKTVDGPRNATMRAIVQGVNEVIMKKIRCSNLCNTFVFF